MREENGHEEWKSAIEKAQEKIASKVISDMHANSEEEWMRMNVNQG